MDNKITLLKFMQFLAVMALVIAAWYILDLLYSMYISPGIPF